MPKHTDCKLLSANETYWDPTAMACEQSSGFGPVKRATIRFSIDLKSTITITKFNHGMREQGAVVFNDLDIDHLLQYLQDVKQLLSEQELVDKLMGR
jgi:hypothetical protein